MITNIRKADGEYIPLCANNHDTVENIFEHGRKCCHSSQVMTDVPTAADLLPAHKQMLCLVALIRYPRLRME